MWYVFFVVAVCHDHSAGIYALHTLWFVFADYNYQNCYQMVFRIMQAKTS